MLRRCLLVAALLLTRELDAAEATHQWAVEGQAGDVAAFSCSDPCGEDIAVIVSCRSPAGSQAPQLAVPWLAQRERPEPNDPRGHQRPRMIHFTIDGLRIERQPEFDAQGLVGFVPHVPVAIDGALTAALATGETLTAEYGGDVVIVSLDGAGTALRRFAASCPPWRDRISASRQSSIKAEDAPAAAPR